MKGMRSFLFLLSGFSLGICVSWPGVIYPNNWKCFIDIVTKSLENKISFKAALSVSPDYLIKRRSKNKASKIRIVSDACFR